MAAQPELIATGVHRVQGLPVRNGISVLLIQDGAEWTLVDTGVAGTADRVREALAALGAGPGDLTRILLTHHHNDHVGGLAGVLGWAPQAEVAASPHEARILTGDLPPDPSSNPLLRAMLRRGAPPRAPIHRVVEEGQVVAGFRVVATPGHSLGHISLLRESDGLLFTADAFGCLLKLRVGVRKSFCSDPALARRSAEKLLEEDFGTVMFAHGAPIRVGAREQLKAATEACRY